jgi:hypothetical protein
MAWADIGFLCQFGGGREISISRRQVCQSTTLQKRAVKLLGPQTTHRTYSKLYFFTIDNLLALRNLNVMNFQPVESLEKLFKNNELERIW